MTTHLETATEHISLNRACELSACAAETLRVQAVRGRHKGWAMGPLPPRATVLVIDGDDLVSATIAGMLDADEHRVLTAWSTVEAWAQLLATPVDIIICNAALPDSLGVAFLQSLRATAVLGAIPAIVISTSDEPRFSLRPYRAFMAMPFEMEDLLHLVATVLGEMER
jgi:CheY-like chemotaxis protein